MCSAYSGIDRENNSRFDLLDNLEVFLTHQPVGFYIYFLKILRRDPVKEAGIIFQNLPNVRSCATYTDIFATLMSLRNILANFQPFTRLQWSCSS